MLEIGTKAPDFALKNQQGETVRLSDFSGKRVVLYFYPKDSTPGCTRQACSFQELREAIEAHSTVILGISKDSVASHLRFAEKNSLTFQLLSDPELEAIKAYDVWQEKKMYGKVSMGVVRTTYVIDAQGCIEQAWGKVKPDQNAAQVLEFLQK